MWRSLQTYMELIRNYGRGGDIVRTVYTTDYMLLTSISKLMCNATYTIQRRWIHDI